MISQVSIANSALVKVGADRIQSIDEDNKRAKVIKAIWDEKRDATLRARSWRFARKRVTLTPNSTTPDWGYDYEYDVPNDCVKFLDTDPDDIDFVVEDGKILTDESELDVLYTYRHTDWSAWDSLFAEAMAWGLAADIAYALTQSLALAESCQKKYKNALDEAAAASSSEGILKGIEADTWTAARRGG